MNQKECFRNGFNMASFGLFDGIATGFRGFGLGGNGNTKKFNKGHASHAIMDIFLLRSCFSPNFRQDIFQAEELPKGGGGVAV